MNEYREISSMLRNLLRNSGAESPEHPIPAVHILALAMSLDEQADDIEMEMIIEMQRKAVA